LVGWGSHTLVCNSTHHSRLSEADIEEGWWDTWGTWKLNKLVVISKASNLLNKYASFPWQNFIKWNMYGQVNLWQRLSWPITQLLNLTISSYSIRSLHPIHV
jgi:hypothetical protein